MELEEYSVCQERGVGDCQTGDESNYDHYNVCLPLLPGDHTIGDIIFTNPLPPPLPYPCDLEVEKLGWRNAEKAGYHELISDASSDVLIGSNSDPLCMSGTAAAWCLGTSAYECSVCSNVFDTFKKHQLTHQEDRLHVCPVTKPGFKHHDHLNVHLLTHDPKRKSFQRTKAFQKSCYDDYYLKRHLVPNPSQRAFCNPSDSRPTQWKDQCADVGPFLDDLTDSADYQSLILSPAKPASGTQHGGTGCASLESYSDYTGFASLGGPRAMSFSGLSVSKGLESWSQGEGKGLCDDDINELHQPLEICGAPPNMRPEFSTTFVDPHCVERTVNVPGSELQAMEEILLFHYKGGGSSGRDSALESALPKSSSQSRPAKVFTKATYRTRKVFKKKSLLKSQLHSFANVRGSVFSETMPTQNFLPNNLNNPDVSYSGKAQSTQRSTIMLPSLAVGVVQPELSLAKPLRKDGRKRARKKKLEETNLPVPPMPPTHLNINSAPWRPRSRPQLVSPSQVAMASFSTESTANLIPSHTSKVKNPGWDQQETCDSYFRDQTLLQPSEVSTQSLSLGQLSRARIEDVADQMQGRKLGPDSGHLQVQKVPSAVNQMSLMPLIIPVSVPVSERIQAALGPIDREPHNRGSLAISTAEKGRGSTRRSKKTRHHKFLKTLFIPSPATPQSYALLDCAEDSASGQRWQAAGGYPSQLRSPVYMGENLLKPSFQPPPYTPPPMLSPLRPGTGLYFSTLLASHPCPPPPDESRGFSFVMDDSVVTIEPRINVSSRFQAEIPPLQNLELILYDEHPAQLVWAPWGEISTNTQTQKRVTELLDLCCSSVCPGGGTNIELALHCLHEVQGDVLTALDLLLTKEDYRSPSHPLWNYHYSGSDYWSPQEKLLFRKALMTHGKDFQLIRSMLQYKSVAQCVEYYYALKKVKKFKQRTQETEKKKGLDMYHTAEVPCGQVERSVKHRTLQKSLSKRTEAEVLTATNSCLEYRFKECGRGFEKIKSRNVHMKTHHQQDREMH